MSTHVNQARRLLLTILDTAKKQGGYAIPESTLQLEITAKARPQLTTMEWDDLVVELLQRKFIEFVRDGLDDEKKFFIKEAGETALRN